MLVSTININTLKNNITNISPSNASIFDKISLYLNI